MKPNMKPFVVVESPYGGGGLAVKLVNLIHDELVRSGQGASQHLAPDILRAILAGSPELAIGRDFDEFSRASFLFDLSVRAAVVKAAYSEMRDGKVVICKNFTDSDIVSARLYGLEWRGQIAETERFSRTIWLSPGKEVEVKPDLVIYIDVPPETARENIEWLLSLSSKKVSEELHQKIVAAFDIDLEKQRQLFLEELVKHKNHLVIEHDLSSELMLEHCLAYIRALD